MKKLNNFVKSKAFVITLSLLFIALVIAGVTYAWFTWSSTDNTNITMQVGEYTTVTYVGGNQINVNNLAPVFNYTDGESTTFTLTNSNTDTSKTFKYNVYLDITSISNELKSTSFKYVLLDGSNNIVDQGNFSTASNGSTLTITENQSLPNGNSSYTFIIYIDGNNENNSNMMNKSLSGSLRVTVNSSSKVTAAQYITNLYTNASKSTATVNSITYNLAPSVNLMNDRHASMSTDINGGDIRYYGATPNNYAWLGDTYESTFTYNIFDGTPITRTAGEKKLWRIIGVFDGRLKLISNDYINDTVISWDTSDSLINLGYGINQWGPSGSYEGADLMRLLNPGYESESVNNSLYWTKGTGTVYTGLNNATTSGVSFANTGLSSEEQNMIDTVTWYLGAQDSTNNVFVDMQYAAERQSNILGKICSSENSSCNDDVTRTSTWDGKVGLPYLSDYGYAADLSLCQNKLLGYNRYPGDSSGYDKEGCYDNNWIYFLDNGLAKISISPHAYSNSADVVEGFGKYSEGSTCFSPSKRFIYPSIYLNPDVVKTGGTGISEDPYVLSLNQ